MTSTRSLAAASAAACLALLAACGPSHVRLPDPPPKSAPFAERQQFYDEHRASAVRPAPQGVTSGLLAPTPLTYVVLEDGTRVDHPEDLLPLVEPTSPTANAAARAEQAALLNKGASAAVITLAGLGIGVMLTSLVPIAMMTPSSSDDPALYGTLALIGGGTLVSLTSLLALPLMMHAGTEEVRERETAFLTYDRSLKERLDLVDEGAPAAPLALE